MVDLGMVCFMQRGDRRQESKTRLKHHIFMLMFLQYRSTVTAETEENEECCEHKCQLSGCNGCHTSSTRYRSTNLDFYSFPRCWRGTQIPDGFQYKSPMGSVRTFAPLLYGTNRVYSIRLLEATVKAHIPTCCTLFEAAIFTRC